MQVRELLGLVVVDNLESVGTSHYPLFQLLARLCKGES